MDPSLSSQLKKQNQLLHKTLFLIYNLKNYRDPLLTAEYELAMKRLPLFVVANLQGLLDALERYGKNETFNSFNGIYQLEQANNNLLTISETDPIRINDLIILVNKVITQVTTAWSIDQTELDIFQAKYAELFFYPLDVFPITYLTASFLSILKGPERDSVWDWGNQLQRDSGLE